VVGGREVGKSQVSGGGWAGSEAVVVKPERWTGVGGLWTVAYAMRQGRQRVRRRDQLTPVRAGRTGKSSSR
jgi:hypothetical protein